MGLLQALIGSVMSLLVTGSVFYIAYRTMTLGNELNELKDLLRSIERNTRGDQREFPSDSPASTARDYPLPLPEDAAEPVPMRELPVPISRRMES